MRANPTRKNNLNNNNNNDRNKKNLENGLYVHSSPPKAINSNNGQGSATIRDYIRAGDIDALEEVVLQGQGTKLVNQPATDQKVRNFLKTVPSYMSKIDLIHDAVEKGNLRDLKALLDRRKLARSKDAQGVGLLHKAVVHDHRGIVDYLISDYPETLDVTDHEGRTALHYCAASNFPDDMYSVLSDAVADPQLEDHNGKTAADYMSNPRELNISKKNNKKGSGGSKGKRMTPPKRKSPGHKIRTPPKREGMTITGANIRIWIHDKDLTQLEKIVWEGQGHRLLGETSNNAKVRQFLNLVPRMMTKIKEVHQAAINGDLETLDAKADPTDILIAKDQNGLTPLHKSAALGLKDVSEWIVQKNHSTLFAQDNKGRTPLFYAGIAKDGGEVYDMLLRSGADKNHNDQYRRTADYYRFKPTDLDVSIIHETPVAPRGGGGSTLDIPSRSSGHSKEGSRAPSRNGRSRNPSRRNSPGEDKKKNDKKNDKNIPQSVQDFKDMKSVSDNEIEAFIREGDLESLEYVILSGRGTDLQGKSSWNDETRRFLKRVPGYMEKIAALHEAAATGNVTNVRRLVKENPKLSMARDKDGAVALHYAAKSGDPKVTKYVLSLYPEAVTLEDNEGRTPLHYAGMAHGAGADEVFTLLEKEGANPDDVDLDAIEELHSAVEEGESRKVMQLLDKKQKAQTRDRNQANILHKAVLHGHTDLVRYMISTFPELIKQEDRAGRTPLHYAAVLRDGGHIYKILEKAGGNPKAKDHSGHSPEDYKNDPKILTQWDLMKELEEGVGNTNAKGRPDTKGSEASNDTRADANMLSDRHKGMLSRRNSTVSSKSEFPGMWSDDGQYLTKVLGDALVRALSEVNEARPKDPISYLACSLYNYRYSEKPDSPTNDSKSIGSTGSGGSGHSTIAMQTVLDSTGGPQQTSPQTRDKNGQNVLHFAASRPHGRSAFYRLVAESGCNLADRDDQYRTPRDVAEDNDLQENVRAIDKWIINLAAEGKQKQLKKLLIDGYDHIADVDDDQGNNVLKVAQNKGQGKTVEFLRGLAAFEEKRDWLHKAIRVGSLPHVQYIADSEDIARAKDVHSRTSLHIATLCEEKEIMEFLATQYPDLLKIGDNLERTPLHYAMAVEGVDQVAKVLVQAGARRAVKDLRGKQPSYYFMNREEIVVMIEDMKHEED